jgi:membrane-bound lytic murein transglycosylase D
MEQKKNPKADLEKLRGTFMSAGLFASLLIVYSIVNMKFYDVSASELGQLVVEQVEEEIIADLNPAYRFRQIPAPQPGGHAYHAVLPRNAAQLFVALEDSIYALEPLAIAVPAAPKPAAPKPSTLTHTVRSGDTLSAISRKYGVSVRDIQQWNGLRGERIDIGQRLKIVK